MANRSIMVGEPAPWFSAQSEDKPFLFDELAGRSVILFFYADPKCCAVAAVLEAIENSVLFTNDRCHFIGINSNPNNGLYRSTRMSRRQIWDQSGELTRLYGVTNESAVAFVTNRSLQITHRVSLDDPTNFINQLAVALRSHAVHETTKLHAPVVIVPNILDPDLCRELISTFQIKGGRETGYAAKINGQVSSQIDHDVKRRLDCVIDDDELRSKIKQAIERRLLLVVYRAFQFRTTWLERYIVGSYDATFGGYFRPHRDNSAPHNAHRRFALSINLNDDYDGGELRFPEFGLQLFRPPLGGAAVFSCSLLHEVLPILSGSRFAFLSFLCGDPRPSAQRPIPSTGQPSLGSSISLPAGTSATIRIAHDQACNDCSKFAAELQSTFNEKTGWNVQRAMIVNPTIVPPSGLGLLVTDPLNLTLTEKILATALTRSSIAYDILSTFWKDVDVGLLVARQLSAK